MKCLGKSEQGVRPLRVHALIFLFANNLEAMCLRNMCMIPFSVVFIRFVLQIVDESGGREELEGKAKSSDPVVWLDRLAAIFKQFTPGEQTNGKMLPCLPVIQEVRDYSTVPHSMSTVKICITCLVSAGLVPKLYANHFD